MGKGSLVHINGCSSWIQVESDYVGISRLTEEEKKSGKKGELNLFRPLLERQRWGRRLPLQTTTSRGGP